MLSPQKGRLKANCTLLNRKFRGSCRRVVKGSHDCCVIGFGLKVIGLRVLGFRVFGLRAYGVLG